MSVQMVRCTWRVGLTWWVRLVCSGCGPESGVMRSCWSRAVRTETWWAGTCSTGNLAALPSPTAAYSVVNIWHSSSLSGLTFYFEKVNLLLLCSFCDVNVVACFLAWSQYKIKMWTFVVHSTTPGNCAVSLEVVTRKWVWRMKWTCK